MPSHRIRDTILKSFRFGPEQRIIRRKWQGEGPTVKETHSITTCQTLSGTSLILFRSKLSASSRSSRKMTSEELWNRQEARRPGPTACKSDRLVLFGVGWGLTCTWCICVNTQPVRTTNKQDKETHEMKSACMTRKYRCLKRRTDPRGSAYPA